MSSDPPTAREVPPPWHASIASVPRPGRRHSEDLTAVVGPNAWVLDGASGPGPAQACCELDVRWYVQRLSTFLAATLDGSSLDLSSALASAISQVAAEHEALCSPQPRGSAPSATVAMLRRRGDILDYLVLGDSSVLLDLGATVECQSDKRLGLVAQEVREQLRNHLAAGRGYDHPHHGRLLNELIAAERAVRNTEGGYWIASLDPDAARHSLCGSVHIGLDDGHVERGPA
jgi:hypothetical protein